MQVKKCAAKKKMDARSNLVADDNETVVARVEASDKLALGAVAVLLDLGTARTKQMCVTFMTFSEMALL